MSIGSFSSLYLISVCIYSLYLNWFLWTHLKKRQDISLGSANNHLQKYIGVMLFLGILFAPLSLLFLVVGFVSMGVSILFKKKTLVEKPVKKSFDPVKEAENMRFD